MTQEEYLDIDGLDSVAIVPSYLYGDKPLDPVLDNIDTTLVLGEGRVDLPLKLDAPILFSNTRRGGDPEVIKGLVYGASLAGIPYSLSGENMTPEIRKFIGEVGGKYILQWTSDRTNIDADLLIGASAIEIIIRGGVGPDRSLLKKTGRMTPSMHLDIESPKDLKKHIDLLKEITGHAVPVMVTIGPGNVYGDVKYCIKAGADAVNLGMGVLIDSSMESDIKNNIGIQTLGLFKPAQRAIKETNAKEDKIKLIMSGGFQTSADTFKALAMGADGVALSGASLDRIMSSLPGVGKDSQDWQFTGEALSKYLKKAKTDLRHLFSLTSTTGAMELSSERLRARTYDAAAITGLKLLGYEKTLPMWMH